MAAVNTHIDGVLQLQSKTLGQNSIQSAEEPASNLDTPLDEDDYEPYHISDFGAPSELLPSTSTPAAVTATDSLTTNHVSASVSGATHKDLGSGLPQGLQVFRSTS